MSPSAILPIGTASCSDVGQECVTGSDGVRGRWIDRAPRRARDDDVVGRVRDAVQADAGDHLRHSRAALGMKLPYGSVRSSGTLPTSKSVNWMPSMSGLCLHLGPGGHAAVTALDQLARCDRACRRRRPRTGARTPDETEWDV